jgi:transaldolase
MHWSEFIGGEAVVSIPHVWQRRFNSSSIEVESRMEKPVDKAVIDELCRNFVDFRRSYEENGMTVEEFDSFGPTIRTLRQFLVGYEELVHIIRDFLIPDPGKK